MFYLVLGPKNHITNQPLHCGLCAVVVSSCQTEMTRNISCAILDRTAGVLWTQVYQQQWHRWEKKGGGALGSL